MSVYPRPKVIAGLDWRLLMQQPIAASATTALAHSNKLGKDNKEFCMSMWAAWRLRTVVEAYAEQTTKREA